MAVFNRALFLFHRDLRLHDNTGLLLAHASSKTVDLCFILDPRQIEDHPFRSPPALAFMARSIRDLSEEVASRGGILNLLQGRTDEVIELLLRSNSFDAFYSNRDYTPFSISRDAKIADVCRANSVQFVQCDDALLSPPGTILKPDGKPYTVYTPFWKRARNQVPNKPVKHSFMNFTQTPLSSHSQKLMEGFDRYYSSKQALRGGRNEAKSLLIAVEKLSNYESERDIPALSSTSLLSAHNKFGTISIREVYHFIASKFGPEHGFIRELYWRDFFTHIGYHFPHVFSGAFHKKFDALPWENNQAYFEAWCNGLTGFPIVDAGMRELNATGFMHNRVRMIVASFLVKDLLIDWHWGERYFAQKLVDYDPAVNNGNWQWVASTGCDAQPYFRIFNPWLQHDRFDPQSIYIKRWIPELKELSHKQIRQWGTQTLNLVNYPAPIVEHRTRKEMCEELFSEVV